MKRLLKVWVVVILEGVRDYLKKVQIMIIWEDLMTSTSTKQVTDFNRSRS